jgi:serine/threonine protein kinase
MICASGMGGFRRPGRDNAGRPGWGVEGRVSEDYPAPGGLAAGARVAGYRVEKPLGAGGMAVVYRARQERLGRLVALKVLTPALAADGEFRRRFTAESRAAAAVDDPHIIPVYEAGEADGVLFIAMRLVAGGDLRRVLAREGPLSPERAAGFLSPVAFALDAAHRAGLVHRDVKPGNILVDAQPDRPEHVYLSDFGISKVIAATAGLTGTGRYLGTPEYTSPEQVKGQAVDGRADQYALACVAWQLLTGTVPFQRDRGLAVLLAHLHEPPPRLADRRPDLTAAAGQVLARAMAKESGERYPSCGEFTGALREALALPPYLPAAPAPAAAGHPRTEVSALPAHLATAPAAARTPSGSGGPAPGPATPPAAADRPTQDAAPSGQHLRPGPGPGGTPARPARRRRYLTITLACVLLAAAAAAIPLLLARPGPLSPAGPHVGTGTATLTPGGKKTQPAAGSRPYAGPFTDPGNSPADVMAYAPGGATLAAGDASISTYLWDTVTGKLTATLTNPGTQGVASLAFSPAGTTLAVGDVNGRIYLWDTATGRLTATLTDPGAENADSVAFSPGGTILAVGDGNSNTYLWDTATRKLTATLTDPNSTPLAQQEVASVAFGPGGTILAVGDENGRTYLWDTATGKLIATLTAPGGQAVYAVAFGPGGTILAVGDDNGNTYLWDTATGKLTATLTDPGGRGVRSVAFAPGGTTLAVSDIDGSIYLWDTATRKLTVTYTDPASNGAPAVAFAPDGTTLAIGQGNGKIYLRSISSSP